jgi:hypothetical protein
MGKYLAILTLVLCLSVSLPAATNVTCAVSGTPTNTSAKFTVNYAYTGTDSFPRAFALDITTSLGVISGVTATKVGESIVGALGFGIFPGTIAIDSAGAVTSVGSPVAPQSDLPGGTMAGLGTSGVTVELGSLYATSAAKPNSIGTILAVAIAFVSSSSARTATINVVPNMARGGVVLEDGTSTGTFVGTTLTITPPPCACGCKGDVNASGKVDSSDVVSLVGTLNTYGGTKKSIASSNTNYKLAGDANANGTMDSSDVVKIVGWLNSYGGAKKTINCPHSYN